LFEQSKKLRETSDDLDEFDDEFSDDEIMTEDDELAASAMTNRSSRRTGGDDIADVISMSSEPDVEDVTAATSPRDRSRRLSAGKLRAVNISRRVKNDLLKVRCRRSRSHRPLQRP